MKLQAADTRTIIDLVREASSLEQLRDDIDALQRESNDMKRPTIIITGEPASGKSEVALAMARVLKWEVREHGSRPLAIGAPYGLIVHGVLSDEQIDHLRKTEDVLAVICVKRSDGAGPDRVIFNNSSIFDLRVRAGLAAFQVLWSEISII